jgi:hypothetical protein
MLPTSRVLLQQAWVVTDLEAAARRWSETCGIGPFFLATYTADRFEGVEHRGRPGVMQMRTAICYAGDVQVELIEPAGDGPSCYRDTVPAGSEGFHHVCYWTHDLDADVEHYLQAGCTMATRGRVKGGPRFAYLDATARVGCMIELLEHSEALAGVFDGWRRRCAEWRGGELFVRR